MAKSNMLKKRREDDFDFSEIIKSSFGGDDQGAAGVIQGLIEISNIQMTLAIALTKGVISKNSDTNMNKEAVFSVFKNASETITEGNFRMLSPSS